MGGGIGTRGSWRERGKTAEQERRKRLGGEDLGGGEKEEGREANEQGGREGGEEGGRRQRKKGRRRREEKGKSIIKSPKKKVA